MNASSSTPTATPSLPHWHSVWWFSASALFNLVAAASAFQHDGRAGLRWGLAALVAALLGVGLRHREKHPGPSPDRLSPTVISLAGLGVLCGAFAGIASLTTRHWRGFDVWGHDSFHLRNEGVVHMALALSLAFLVLAAWQAIGRRHTALRTGWRVGLTVLGVLLLGPEMALEENTRPEVHPVVYTKRSLAGMWRVPSQETVLLQWEDGPGAGDPPRVCAALARHTRFGWLAWQTPLADEPRESACGEQVLAAMASGAAVESTLLRGDLDSYFLRVHADPALRAKPVALDMSALPPALRGPLEALLTQAARTAFTPFDVALAARRRDDAEALMPEADTLQLHQRQGAFDLGMGDAIGAIDAEAREREADAARAQRIQTLGMMAGMSSDPFTLRMLMASVLMGGEEASRTGLGPFGPLDFAMANRRCDVRYAEYLHGRGLRPTVGHALHLTSLVGRAQYPGISPEFSRDFPSADESIGLPDAAQLAHCADLARFYAARITDWGEAMSAETPIDESPLGRLYLDAAAAVGQWYFRDAETWRKAHDLPPRVQDTRVIGAPEVAVEVAHALIASRPASFEHYCMWSNTWYAWMLQTKQQRPGLTQPMQDLAASWRQAPPVPRDARATCRLVGLPWRTNEYDDMRQGLAMLNADLRRLGLPCQWRGQGQEFTCRMPVALTR